MEIQKNMAAVMRAIKENRGKSLGEFSADLEISRSALQEYLSGTGNPNLSTIDHIAHKLGVDTLFLISGSFTYDQAKVLLQLLNTLELLSELSPAKRQRFAELLLDLILLWEEDSSGE